MISHDERVDYYLMVTRLMAEADAQLEADAADRGSHSYAEDLETLRHAVQEAQQAAARVLLTLVTNRHAMKEGERDPKVPAARH